MIDMTAILIPLLGLITYQGLHIDLSTSLQNMLASIGTISGFVGITDLGFNQARLGSRYDQQNTVRDTFYSNLTGTKLPSIDQFQQRTRLYRSKGIL